MITFLPMHDNDEQMRELWLYFSISENEQPMQCMPSQYPIKAHKIRKSNHYLYITMTERTNLGSNWSLNKTSSSTI